MSRINISKTIDAPVDRVFSVMSDIPHAEETVSGITKIEMLTDGPVDRGTRWRETRLMFGREATEELEITRFVPNRSYAVECESCGVHFKTDFRFHPQDGQTKVEMEMTTRPLSWMARIMSPLTFMMRGMLIKALTQDLDDCKRAIESKHQPGVA